MVSRRGFLKGMASLALAMNLPLATVRVEAGNKVRSSDYITATEVRERQDEITREAMEYLKQAQERMLPIVNEQMLLMKKNNLIVREGQWFTLKTNDEEENKKESR